MINQDLENHTLITKKQVLAHIGLGNTKLTEMVNNNEFPQPIRFSSNCIRWKLSEVLQWIEDKANSRNL
ncbi:helix-turn-helix transcriptional regulator [Gallibacterium salpingitidis]|uniref:Transcriptional regulator n=1 Tax=Gallibacterium salpingitidis TaxID=505341 RepID=A0A1A7P1T9_9PAST|nr:AlpA family phage regulatory protein [Gallibacterium salpingitidis]OBW95199.1 hypothetical protein QS62_04220 [Gallibacterium salpingitidis]